MLCSCVDFKVTLIHVFLCCATVNLGRLCCFFYLHIQIYTFLTDNTRAGMPFMEDHHTPESTQINKRNTICRQNHMLQCQWGHTNHIKSHCFHFRISYLQLKRLYSLIPNHSIALILRNSQKLKIWFSNIYLKWVHPIIFVSNVFHNSHLIQKCIQNQKQH